MNRALCLLALCAVACTDQLPLVGTRCPCDAGTTCVVDSSTCVAGPEIDGASDLPMADLASVELEASVAEPDAPFADATTTPDQSPADAVPWRPADGGWSDDVPQAAPDGGYNPCPTMGVFTVQDFETQFLIPRCAGSGCHQAIFPPRNLDHLDMIRQMLVNVPSVVLCKSDRYIDTANVEKSFMLAKVLSTTVDVQCPSGGAPNSGGTRMPNVQGSAGTAGPRLTDAEIECYTWWLDQMAKQ